MLFNLVFLNLVENKEFDEDPNQRVSRSFSSHNLSELCLGEIKCDSVLSRLIFKFCHQPKIGDPTSLYPPAFVKFTIVLMTGFVNIILNQEDIKF